MIYSCIAKTWLYKLRFVYKEVRKDVFVNDYEQSDMLEDENYFLIKINELKAYIIEFNKDGAIKAKDYLVDYAVGGEERRSIIIITYNKCIFSANDGV